MKKLLLLLVLSPLGLYAQSGTLTLGSWSPRSSTCAPQINETQLGYAITSDSLTLRFQFDLALELSTTAFVNGESYTYPTITARDLALFQLSRLETTAELYAGGRCLGKIELDWQPSLIGNRWVQQLSHKRNWSSFGGCRGGDLSLRNLKLKAIDFDGEREFKNRLSGLLAKEAEELVENGDWKAGLKAYKSAKAVADPYAKIYTAICELERKIKQYDDLIEQGDRALKANKFLAAKSIYEKIERTLIAKPYTQARIKDINFRIKEYELKYRFAQEAFEQANDAPSLKFAKRKFEDALRILPVDKESEINEYIQKVTTCLERIYDDHIDQADQAFSQKRFVDAAQLFIEASKVYDRNYPNERLQACIREKRRELLAVYKPKRDVAKKKKQEAANQVCLAIDVASESCFLSCYEELKCQESHYKSLIANIQREVDALIYHKYYTKPSMNCGSSTCAKVPKNKYTAPAFLAAAKRKHQLDKSYSIADLSKYRDEYIEQAINLNPSLIDAYLFKAQVSSSKVDKIVLYRKVLTIDAKHEEAQQALQEWETKLKASIFRLIDQHDLDEVRKAMQLGMLKESFQKGQRNIVQYVIDHDRAAFLALFFTHQAQLNSNIPWNPQVLLQESIEQESLQCAKLLLTKNWADPNEILANQDPFLLQAIEKENLDLVRLLLSFDAVPHSTSRAGNSALFTAITTNQDVVGVQLLEKLSLEAIDQASIFSVVKKSKMRLLKLLLAKGVDVDLANQNRQSLLHLAVDARDMKTVSLLLTNGANVMATDQYGNIPLVVAAKHNTPEICKKLLSKTVQVDVPNAQQETALYWAAKHNSLLLMKQLLLRKAAADGVISLAKQRNEATCVRHIAIGMADLGIQIGRKSFVEKSVATIPAIGWEKDEATGLSLLELAAKQNRNDLFFVLANLDQIGFSRNGQHVLQLAINQDNKVIVNSIFSGSHQSESQVFTINTTAAMQQFPYPLHEAIRQKREQVIPVIIQFVNINKQDERGWTALHEAIHQSNTKLVKELIAQGANPKIKTNRGFNAKKFAKSQNKKHLIKALKD